MLTISARLLHGTIRAGSPHDTVMAGGEPEAEWPPSPARLFSALVAADGTRERCQVTTGEELLYLERLPAPVIHADHDEIEVTRLRPRFVVKDARVESTVQDYPARTSVEVRPGVRVSPRTPELHYVWDDEVDAQFVHALEARAHRVGYLGCSDSPVQLSVATDTPTTLLPAWSPGAVAGTALPVPYEGFTAALDWAFDEWTGGAAVRRAHVPNRWSRYSVGDDTSAEPPPTIVWLELDRPVSPLRSLSLTEALRAAILSHVSGAEGDWVLHGHNIPTEIPRPYQLARFVPLVDVGHRYSGGSVHGACVWLPPDTDPGLVEAIRSVLHAGLRLRSRWLKVEAHPRTDLSPKWSTNPARWSQRSKTWFSATPAVVERGRRGGPTVADVRAWFSNAGHPAPEVVRISPVPTRPGVARLSGREVHRSGKDRYPFYWIEARFASPVMGPICIGRSRSFGMGLMAPDLDGGDSDG